MWLPVVTDTALISDIAKKIEEIHEILLNHVGQTNLGLMAGSAGLLLHECYYADFVKCIKAEAKSEELLSKIFLELSTSCGISFSEGISGIFWTLAHLKKNQLITINEHFFNETKNAIAGFVTKTSSENFFDFLYGSTGAVMALNEAEPHLKHGEWLRYLSLFGSIPPLNYMLTTR